MIDDAKHHDGGQRDGRLLSLDPSAIPAGLFAISLEAGLKIPREWDELMRLPGLAHIAEAAKSEERVARQLEWAERRIGDIDVRRARFVVPTWGIDRWTLVDHEDDAALGGWDETKDEKLGVDIVGMRLDMSYLSRDQQKLLLFLLSCRSPSDVFERDRERVEGKRWIRDYPFWVDEPITPSEKVVQQALLCLCPREGALPPIDLDAEKDAPSFDKDEAGRIAVDYARRIEAHLRSDPRFGTPRYYVSSAKSNSMHIDFVAPEGVQSAHLAEAWGAMVCPMLVRLGIPANTLDLKGLGKGKKPPIFADSTLYEKYPDSRGGLWRPPGASKPGAKNPKRLMPDLANPSVTIVEPKRPRDWKGREVDADALRRAIELVAASEAAAKFRQNVETKLQNVLEGLPPDGRASQPRVHLAVSYRPAGLHAMPSHGKAKPRESTAITTYDKERGSAALARYFSRHGGDKASLLAMASCMLSRFPVAVVAAALSSSSGMPQDEAVALVGGINFKDGGSAWKSAVDVLGLEGTGDLLDDLAHMRLSHAGGTYVPPGWASTLAITSAAGMRPLTDKDIPNETLRRYVESNPRLLESWFKVTGDSSGDEYQFGLACHGTDLSYEEARYLCVLKPGSKSGSDPRGAGYAERNVLDPIIKNKGRFGPGILELVDSGVVHGSPEETKQAEERRREREQIKRERAAAAGSREDAEDAELAKGYTRVVVHSLGEASLPGVANALASNRIKLFRVSNDAQTGHDLGSNIRQSTMAVATWLLAEGLPDAAVEATLASSLCPEAWAKTIVPKASDAMQRRPVKGEDWIKAKFPDVHAAVAPVLAAELLERNHEARRAFVQERDRRIAQAHLAQAASLLPDAGLDGACRAHAEPRHEHGPGCGDSCGHGHGRPPDEPPRIEVGGPPPLYRLAKRLKEFFGTPSKVYGPKAAATVLSFLLGFGMPGTVAASTFRHAGLPEAEHVWDTLRENARKHPEALRAAVTKEVGERAVSRIVASIERDLVMGADALDPVTRSRLYQNFVGRWSLLPEERDYMLVLAAAAKDRKPTRLPGMGAAERAAEHALNERIKKTRRGLQYAAKCGIFRQYMKCPTHGDRGSRALVTDREIMCRHCAWRWARGYRDWIAQKWPEKVNLVKVEIPAWSAGPGEDAPFDARDRWRTTAEHMREVSVAASRIKSARWGDVYDRVTAGEHDAPPPEATAEPADEGEEDEGSGAWSKWIVGTKPTEDPGFQALNRRPKRWVYGRDHFLVIMPLEVVEQKEAGAKVIEHRRPQGQYLHLFAEAHRRLGRKVTEPKPLTGHPLTHHEQHPFRYVVTREEAAKQVYETLMSLNHAFDDMLRDRDPWLGYFEWLAPGIKRTTATDGGKQALSWPDRDQIRKFMADSNKDPSDPDKEEEEVEGGRCDADVPDESDPERKRTKKCRLACHIILAHEPTQTVIAQNTQGILYGIDDALARANELGVPETLPFDDLE